MADQGSDVAVSVCFSLRVDNHELGIFTSCEGLGCEVTVEQREEGGNNAYVHQLATRIKYTNVKLSRPVNGDTQKLAKWFASMASEVTRTNGEIVALTQGGKRVARWSLIGVIPVRWQGPSFNVDSPKAATETLEIAHHGFLDPGAPG